MKKIEYLILASILLMAFVLRLYKINRPLADWHSWRQADTAAVSRNYIKEGFNPFIPRYDDMSSQANTIDNPQRYRFVEFPIYNTIIAAVWKISGVNVTAARLTTVVITLVSTIILYMLVKYYSGWQIAALTAFFFAIIPYNVYYSSAILPGPLMVLGILALYYSFTRWLENEKKIKWLVSSILFANLAILTWPIAIFFLLPLVYLSFEKYKINAFKNFYLWIFLIFTLAPFMLWRIWMTQFPSGIPNWKFLLNEGNIRFKGAFFRWIIVERLGKLILTVGGFTLLIVGLLKKPQKEKLFYYTWLTSAVLYFSVMASGNIRHDYYQVPFVPIAAIFMSLGTISLFSLPTQFFNKSVGPIVAIILILFMIAFGYFEVRGFYWINKPQIVNAGQAVDRLLPKEATIIAPYNGDAAFLYQTNRHGYPIVDRPLEQFITEGTKYLVSVDINDSGIQNLAKHCKIIEKTGDYIIIEMFKECVGR